MGSVTRRTWIAPLACIVWAGVAEASGASPQAASAAQFERRMSQAAAAKAPGGSPDSESKARLAEIAGRYLRRVSDDNARVMSRVAQPRPVAPQAQAAPTVGGRTMQKVTPAKPSSPAVPPASGESARAGGAGVAPDPCGSTPPFEARAVQTTPPVDPGDAVVVQGCGFGSSRGELRLVGDFPGGHLKLNIQSWGPNQIIAYVPMVTGVGDMPGARLQVVRPDGRFSGMTDVGGFRATREVRRLQPADVAVTCGHPSASDDADCRQSEGTFGARHGRRVMRIEDCSAVQALNASSASEYTDQATVNLANGWVLAGYAWWWWREAGSGYVQQPAGFNVNAASATIGMRWGNYFNSCVGPRESRVRYRVDLYIVGPKGVPYR